MAAPSGIVWGSTVGSYGRIGIYAGVTTTATTVSVSVQVWFWSKYSVSDTGNTLYFDNLSASGSATTSRGSVSVDTNYNSGSGWSTSNQQKLATYSYSYTRGTSASTRYLYAKLINIDRVGGTMYASTSFSVPKLASYAVKYNANGGSGAPSAQTKWYGKTLTLSSTKPTRTGHSFQGWGTTASDTSVNYAAGASYTANAAITLYAIWKANTYTIKYNANGGSGAPGNQTKTYGVNLTLSSTKPTRTGYTFQGWALTSGGAVYYAAGGTCGKNENLTLYAVWKANTYTVTYNANGGSGAPSAQSYTYASSGTITLSSTKPTRTGYTFSKWNSKADGSGTNFNPGASYNRYNTSITLYAQWTINTYTIKYDANGGTGAPASQTKTYGKVLTLSSTKPTRTNYTFKGWATSASATTATYSAGGSYMANVSDTLYAVWELSYVKPRITGLSVFRCISSGTASDEGWFARVKFNWACDKTVSSITIKWKLSSASTYSNSKTVTSSGTSGSVDEVVSSGTLSPENTYDFYITVSDANGSTSKLDHIEGMAITIDALAGGNGVSFGKPAELDGYADFGYKVRCRENQYFDNNCGLVGRTLNDQTLNLISININDNTIVGYGGYVEGIGRTNLYGNSIHMWPADKIYVGESMLLAQNRVLWSGGYYMSAAHTADLSSPINQQANGIVLVFSRYIDGASVNYGWSSHFVPKNMISTHGGTGHSFVMAHSKFGCIATKYLYLSNTNIVGNDDNITTGTVNGITYNNKDYVLRYVIGV